MIAPLALALLLAAPQDDRAPAGPATPTEGTVRVEHFVLEQASEDGPRAVAVLAFRRVATPGGYLLEQEVQFETEGLRILIDEQHDASGPGRSPRLVWRELRSSPSTGRTWLAEWDEERGQVVTASHGTRAPVHGVLAGPQPTWPLDLIEKLRTGARPARVEVLDALGRGRVTLSIDVREEGERRIAELRREDGSLASRYVFEGENLVELQLQGGDRVARPCEASEFRRRSLEWRVHYDPLEELGQLARAYRGRTR